MNPVIGQVLTAHYSPWLVGLSFLASFAGSLVALWCAQRMVSRSGKTEFGMIACGAVALGGIGIWSMHFIGMQAYRLPVPIEYDVPLTALSLVAAILISGIALYLAGARRQFSKPGWAIGSLLAGAGVCVMHYMGMYAMNMRASMAFDTLTVALSIAIAGGAAGAALWPAFHVHRLSYQVASAAVMGLAVCSMHYVGMSAADMICTASAPHNGLAIGGAYIGLGVFGMAGLALIFIFWVLTSDGEDMPGATAAR